MKENNISIVEIGKIVGECYDGFENVWTGYNQEMDKIDIICAIRSYNPEKSFLNNLISKINVNIAKQYGTQFVKQYCNISIINYL